MSKIRTMTLSTVSLAAGEHNWRQLQERVRAAVEKLPQDARTLVCLKLEAPATFVTTVTLTDEQLRDERIAEAHRLVKLVGTGDMDASYVRKVRNLLEGRDQDDDGDGKKLGNQSGDQAAEAIEA